MTISHKADAPLDLLLGAALDAGGSKIINSAVKLLVKHGVARATAEKALRGALGGKAMAVRIGNAEDPKALLDGLAVLGFPAKRLKGPAKAEANRGLGGR